MHPNAAFRGSDVDGWSLVETVGLATIAFAAGNQPTIAHAPLTRHGRAELRFHLARANRAFAHAKGRTVASVLGPHGYVSPGWTTGDPRAAVPTWNYVAAEFEGVVEPLEDHGLREHLERKAADWEPAEPRWSVETADPARVGAMLPAIGGFRLIVEDVRVTRKLGQNKSAKDRDAVAAGLVHTGNAALAEAMLEKRA